jgi:N-acetylmuramoyl-L-alanine amidase
MRRLGSVLFFIVLSLHNIGAQNSGFANWLEQSGTLASIDPLLGTLILQTGTASLLIPANKPWGILNGQEKRILNGFSWNESGVVFDAKAREGLQDILFPLIQNSGRRRISTIFIDPGHGGKDPGAIGVRKIGTNQKNVEEKTVVLKTALLLQELLKIKFKDIAIVMSRSSDQFLSLDDRTSKANALARSKDDIVLFVSVHANASLNPRAKGFEVWYLPPNSRRQVVRPGDYDVDSSILPIINTLREEELSVESHLLAASILDGIQASTGNDSVSRGLKQEEWYVVRNSFMPSVLVELGFLTNQDEIVLLDSDEYLKKIATGIYNGIVAFIDAYQAVQR